MKMSKLRCLGLLILFIAAVGCDNGNGNGSDAGTDAGSDAGSDGGDENITYVWEQLGGQVSPAGAESEDPTMLVIGSSPAVGYRHQSFRVHLNIYDGSTWGTSQPDPSSNNSNSSIYSTPDFCTSGQDVFMAYSHAGDAAANDDTFYDRIFVYRWEQAAGWAQQNGGAEVSVVWSDPPGGVDAWEPAIACPPSGDPRVAWVEADVVPDPDTEDGAWVAEVGAASSTRSSILSRNNTAGSYATDVRTLGLAIDGSGNPIVAQWEQDETEQWLTNLYVSRYSAGSFSNLGDAIADDWDSNTLPVPSVVTDGSDVYVAYSEANSTDDTRHIYVKRYNGSWETVGSGPVSAFSASDHYNSNNPDLLMVDGQLWLAWQESDQYDGPFIYVAYFDSGLSEWVIDGDQLNIDIANSAADPSLAYSAGDGYLHVAFEENTDGHPHIFVKRKRINP
jgi:hypothetical protein